MSEVSRFMTSPSLEGTLADSLSSCVRIDIPAIHFEWVDQVNSFRQLFSGDAAKQRQNADAAFFFCVVLLFSLRRTCGIRPCRSFDVVRPGHRRTTLGRNSPGQPFKVNHELSIRTQELKESASVPSSEGACHEPRYLAHLSP